MAKLENFKKFVFNHPEFIDLVRKNKMSWQSLYELYDLYGEDENVWKKYINEDVKDTFSVRGLLNTIKNIDINSLEENITNIQKAVGLVEELTKDTKKEEIKTQAKETNIEKLYGDNDGV